MREFNISIRIKENNNLNNDVLETLKELFVKRACELILDGYNSGILNEELVIGQEDEVIEFSGSWDIDYSERN